MLKKLKSLVFGLDEFEKAKIELRFSIINNILQSIKINNLEDFEDLEEVIYKIKEELRVKSSNINKTIQNPARVFKKRDVTTALDSLVEIKYNFLKKAFTSIELLKEDNQIINENTIKNEENLDFLEENSEESLENEEILEETNNFEEFKENIEKNSKEPEKIKKSQKNLNLLEKLEEIKKDIDISDDLKDFKEYQNKSKNINIEKEDNKEKENNETKKINFKEQENINNLKKTQINEPLQNKKRFDLVYQDSMLKVGIINLKVPCIQIIFQNEFDFNFIKNIYSIIFEIMNCHGLNLIISQNKVLFVPRYQNDNLFEINRIEADLEKIFTELSNKKENIDFTNFINVKTNSSKDTKEEILEENNENKEEEKISNDELEEKLKEESEELETKEINLKKQENKEIDEETKEEEFEKETKDYIKIERKILPEKPTLKNKEDSLDSLLDEIEKTKKDLKPNPNPKNDNENIRIIEEEPIKVEKKEIFTKVVPLKKEDTLPFDDKIQLELKSDFNKEKMELGKIYEDEKIFAYLEKESSVLGLVKVKFKNNSSFETAELNDLTYISLFSKVFSTILFDILKPHGTNVFFDYKSNEISIIPRFENDNLKLTWETKTNTDDFLEQIKNKLFQVMNKDAKPKEKVVEKKDKSELQKKAKSILTSLKKIP